MPRYLFHGTSPRALPEFAIDYVAQGDTIETLNPIDHPDFELTMAAEEPAKSKSQSASEATSPAKSEAAKSEAAKQEK